MNKTPKVDMRPRRIWFGFTIPGKKMMKLLDLKMLKSKFVRAKLIDGHTQFAVGASRQSEKGNALHFNAEGHDSARPASFIG